MRLEFLLIRYVPDVVKAEYVNFGILVREAGNIATTRVCVTNDWSRVLGLDPDADVEMLMSLGFELVNRARSAGQTRESLDKFLLDQLSLMIQVTELQAAEADSFESWTALLMQMYVERRFEPAAWAEGVRQPWTVYPRDTESAENLS